MDHKSEIEDDIAQGRSENLRDTFDQMVAWNSASEIEGLENADDLMSLFKRTCEALRSDDAITPHETVQHLASRMGVDVDTTIATYGGAARFALRQARTWWPKFTSSFRHLAG